MTGITWRNICMFERLCGTGSLQNIIVVTTMWDLADDQAGLLCEKVLLTNLWKLAISSRPRMRRFDNTYESAWSILGQLTSTHRPLLLQVEMVNEGKSFAQTAAGSVLLECLEHLILQFRQMITRLQRWLRGISKGSQTDEELLRQRFMAEQRLEEAYQQRELLESERGTESAAGAFGPAGIRKEVAEVTTMPRRNMIRKKEKQCGDGMKRMVDIGGGHAWIGKSLKVL
jgi:hypothetical protein